MIALGWRLIVKQSFLQARERLFREMLIQEVYCYEELYIDGEMRDQRYCRHQPWIRVHFSNDPDLEIRMNKGCIPLGI